ncbi:MAG: hypothetical protein L0210_03175 [Rhodospirillales bacterium]|nr:hypothetical protein [Rhodospirillales bacterium]
MPFHPIQPPRPGTVDHAAYRIYRILEREERAKMHPGDRFRRGEDKSLAQTQVRDAAELNEGPRDSVPRPLNGIDEQRAEQLEVRRRRKRRQAEAQTSPLEPATDYGVGERIGDLLSGVGKDDYEDYVGANAAQSEMVGSQMPGRERGPADAYRHILWAAELTRRFGEQRARQILELHEREGQQKGQPHDEEAMDRNNNEIGIAIGGFARGWNDVISAARKVISGSAADGGGTWKDTYDPSSTLAPHAAIWLPENRWAKNPRVDVKPRLIGRGVVQQPPEMSNVQTNWYSNPNHPDGPDWVAGYLPDGYGYPFGLPYHAVGPNDPRLLRAIGANEAYLKWDRYLP